MRSMTHAMTPNSIQSTASPDTTQYQVGGLLAAEVVFMPVSPFVVVCGFSGAVTEYSMQSSMQLIPSAGTLIAPRPASGKYRTLA